MSLENNRYLYNIFILRYFSGISISPLISQCIQAKAPTKLWFLGIIQWDTNIHIYIYTYGGFLSHRGSPSHHPFLDGISRINQPAIKGYPHDYGNPHIRVNPRGDPEILFKKTWLRGWDWCPNYWGFVEQITKPAISLGDEISPIDGWCETLGHLPTPVAFLIV